MQEHAHPEFYEPEDINPVMMALVEQLWNQRAQDNEVKNNKNLVNTYACPECGGERKTVDLSIGITPMDLPCPTRNCPGRASSASYEPRVHVDYYEGPVDVEFYRPISSDECNATKKTIEESAFDTINANRSVIPHTEWETRYKGLVAEAVRYVVTGGLVERKHTR